MHLPMHAKETLIPKCTYLVTIIKGTTPIYPNSNGRIFGKHQDISETICLSLCLSCMYAEKAYMFSIIFGLHQHLITQVLFFRLTALD